METIDHLLIELYKFSNKILTLEAPLLNLTKIKDFENRYNLILPKDYIYLLGKHDGIDMMGTAVLGFNGIKNLISVYEYEHFEVSYPQYNYLVPFSPDGRGNFYCFDTRTKTNNNESCPVIFWTSNYQYNINDEPEVTNSSFSEWLDEVIIKWTLESYNYDGTEKH
jgi:hypothetical protein